MRRHNSGIQNTNLSIELIKKITKLQFCSKISTLPPGVFRKHSECQRYPQVHCSEGCQQRYCVPQGLQARAACKNRANVLILKVCKHFLSATCTGLGENLMDLRSLGADSPRPAQSRFCLAGVLSKPNFQRLKSYMYEIKEKSSMVCPLTRCPLNRGPDGHRF